MEFRIEKLTAAHPDEEISLSREDVDDLQVFVYAITEYIYDLTDRYEDFKATLASVVSQ